MLHMRICHRQETHMPDEGERRGRVTDGRQEARDVERGLGHHHQVHARQAALRPLRQHLLVGLGLGSGSAKVERGLGYHHQVHARQAALRPLRQHLLVGIRVRAWLQPAAAGRNERLADSRRTHWLSRSSAALTNLDPGGAPVHVMPHCQVTAQCMVMLCAMSHSLN